MATIQEALRSELVAAASVSTLVGSRVYPNRAPSSPTLPYVVVLTRGTRRKYCLTGEGGLARPRIELHCYADGYTEAASIADAVRQVLEAAIPKRTLGSSPDTADHYGITIDDEREQALRPVDASDVWKYRVTLDTRIWHPEATGN